MGLGLFELLRRGMWSLLRVEHETLTLREARHARHLERRRAKRRRYAMRFRTRSHRRVFESPPPPPLPRWRAGDDVKRSELAERLLISPRPSASPRGMSKTKSEGNLLR